MKESDKKKIIVVAGPTAVGKTSAAIGIAQYFNTEIISADSRQCFHELNIGVARPTVEELQQVKHHFIASHSIHDDVNASVFEQFAVEKVNELFRLHDVVVMVGGTGLYIRAFCEGLDEIPAVPSSIRNSILEGYEEKGLNWLREEIRIKDPDFYKVGEIQNPQRMMRALEVVEATGKSVLHFRKGKQRQNDFIIIKIGLELSKEQLLQRINTRVDKMMENKLIDEVKGLQPFKRLNALQTVGYAELFEYLEGKATMDEAIDAIKMNTRRYAKRQMTWFRRDKNIKWFAPGATNEIIQYITGS